MMHAMVLVLAVTIEQAAIQVRPVERQVLVRPETVTVGTPFDVIVRVTAPRGSVIRFPSGPDSTAVVRMLDPVAVTTQESETALVQTATYRMAAWNVNEQPIDVGDIVVATADGPQRLAVNARPIMVVSVLPADSAARVPKPARDLFAAAQPWWSPWLPLLVLAALLVAIFRWWYRRRGNEVLLPGVGALERSEREFQRIEAMRLIEAGERGRYVVLMVDALREFLAGRFAATSASQTSAELLSAIEDQSDKVPVERVAQLFTEADMVKFAQRNLSAATALRLGREAGDIARSIGDPQPVISDEQDREDAA